MAERMFHVVVLGGLALAGCGGDVAALSSTAPPAPTAQPTATPPSSDDAATPGLPLDTSVRPGASRPSQAAPGLPTGAAPVEYPDATTPPGADYPDSGPTVFIEAPR